jgi:endonuclease/exonuclease/phosphatase family metal-dependent hydrolase
VLNASFQPRWYSTPPSARKDVPTASLSLAFHCLLAKTSQEILSKDKNARIITAGDFNEFTFVEPLKQYVQISGLKDMDAVAGIDELERYTYLFDMNAQQLDHMFISPSLTSKAKYEHVHLTTWVSYDEQVSDHDPSVARMDVCV